MPRRYEPEPSAAKVGERIRDLRLERNMSPDDLAQAAGFTKTQIMRLEYGLSTVTAQTISRLAKALDLPAWCLLTYPPDDEVAKVAELIRMLPLADVKKLRRELTKAVQTAAKTQVSPKRD
jgi:transcriptional regulator with XRE-family HTH domain